MQLPIKRQMCSRALPSLMHLENTQTPTQQHTWVESSPTPSQRTVFNLSPLWLSSLNKSPQMNAFDFPQLTAVYPHCFDKISAVHIQSSDTEPERRKIFTCVEEVNKCSLFTCWDQSCPRVLDFQGGGGGWRRDEKRAVCLPHEGEERFGSLGMENARWAVRSTRSLESNRGTPRWAFGQEVNEDA